MYFTAGSCCTVYSGSLPPGTVPDCPPLKHGVGIDSSYSAQEIPRCWSWWNRFSEAGAVLLSAMPEVIAK